MRHVIINHKQKGKLDGRGARKLSMLQELETVVYSCGEPKHWQRTVWDGGYYSGCPMIPRIMMMMMNTL